MLLPPVQAQERYPTKPIEVIVPWGPGGGADVPVSAEFGYDILLPQVRAVLAKAGTDPRRLQLLTNSIERFAASPEYQKFIEQQLALPDSFISIRQAHPYLQSELEALRKLVTVYGAK